MVVVLWDIRTTGDIYRILSELKKLSCWIEIEKL
jgi:hypothetical protein